MARYGKHGEQTYRQNFNRKKKDCIDWLLLNLSLARRVLDMDGLLAIAIDPCYISKAGKKTPHIGRFWSGCAGAVKHGLEIMGIGLLDVVNNKCMMLRAHQTLGNSALKMRNKTLVEYYISVMKRHSKKLLSITDIVVVDAFSPHPRSRRACRSLASIWSAASVTTLVCITFPRRKRGVDDQESRETRLTWQTSTSHAWIDRETTSKTLQKSSVIQKISVTLSSVIIAIIVCKILIFNTLRLQQFFANHHFSGTYILSNSR